MFRSTTTLTQCSALRVVQVYLRSHFNPFKTTLWWWHEDDISFPVHRLWDLELLFNRNSFIHSLTFLICWLMVKLRTFALMPTLSMERSVAKCKALFWVTWKWPTKRYVLSITPEHQFDVKDWCAFNIFCYILIDSTVDNPLSSDLFLYSSNLRVAHMLFNAGIHNICAGVSWTSNTNN